MYGLHILDVLHEIRQVQRLMVVVGAEKVPREVFELADWNVAVGHQPHSEVAALAVFLVLLLGEDALRTHFEDALLEIVPSERGKKVLRRPEKNGKK